MKKKAIILLVTLLLAAVFITACYKPEGGAKKDMVTAEASETHAADESSNSTEYNAETSDDKQPESKDESQERTEPEPDPVQEQNSYPVQEPAHEPEKTEESSVKESEPLKSLDEIAWDVLNGKWGHGDERKASLSAAGYNYDEVQQRVGEMVAEIEAEKAAEEAEKKAEESSKKAEPVQEQESKPAEEPKTESLIEESSRENAAKEESSEAEQPKAESSKAEPKAEMKSIDEIAQEVIDGKWSANDERRQMLTAAGYDYEAVQTRVNELVAERDAKAAEEAARKAAEESARKAEEEAAKAAEEAERKAAEESARRAEEEAQKAAEEAEAEEPVSEEEQETAEAETPTAPWSEYGTAGKLMSYDVGLNAALYYVSISDGAANQEVVDERNSAAYMVCGNQVIIADHYYHGFNRLWYAEVGDTAYIEQSDGSKQYMTVTRIEPNGHNAGSMLVDNDWNNAYESDADVLMYTCNPIGGSSVTILYWNYS